MSRPQSDASQNQERMEETMTLHRSMLAMLALVVCALAVTLAANLSAERGGALVEVDDILQTNG